LQIEITQHSVHRRDMAMRQRAHDLERVSGARQRLAGERAA
jgi:hypothetical protein